jgi:hypothetical protein
MALYVVKDRHDPEKCPARDAQMGSMLLNHIAPTNAGRHGIKFQREAVTEGGHTFYLIAEASNQAFMNWFMEPFARAASTEILAASTCEEVAERGTC